MVYEVREVGGKEMKKDICKTCGFDKNIPREPVFLSDNVLSFISYEEGRCKECGHQEDGSTLPKEEKR